MECRANLSKIGAPRAENRPTRRKKLNKHSHHCIIPTTEMKSTSASLHSLAPLLYTSTRSRHTLLNTLDGDTRDTHPRHRDTWTPRTLQALALGVQDEADYLDTERRMMMKGVIQVAQKKFYVKIRRGRPGFAAVVTMSRSVTVGTMRYSGFRASVPVRNIRTAFTAATLKNLSMKFRSSKLRIM